MVILVQKENEQDQAYIFQDAYFKSSQIYQLKITYRLKHTNHDILLNVLFQNHYRLFLRAHSLHQLYLPYLSYCKNLLFQVMMFH